jgi:uncharacterized protein (DUF488 family)
MTKLFTIGYEGISAEQMLDILRSKGIDILIDVRKVPLSRKRGFSKRGLAELAEGAGIEYQHLGQLGDPKPGREAARRGDMGEFRKIFRNHLRRVASQKALDDLVGIATSSRVCLLCYERDASVCHRSMVADAISARKTFDVVHIMTSDKPSKARGSRDITPAGFAVA